MGTRANAIAKFRGEKIYSFRTGQRPPFVPLLRIMKTLSLCFFLCTTFSLLAQGQNENNNNNQTNQDATQKEDELEARVKELESNGNNRFWQGNINGGEIMVAVDRIGAISKTQFLLDGGLLCTEVVIDTLGGQSLTRIYHVVPASEAVAANAATKIVDRETGAVMYGEVPAGSVVVAGSMPSKGGINLYCAVIVKKVDAQTRSKTSINELLRD